MTKDMEEYDFDKICRVCKTKSDYMSSVFKNDQEDVNGAPIADMLMACTSVLVTTQDGLPNLICNVCTEQLNNAYNFKRQCEDTDSVLRQYLRNKKLDVSRNEQPEKNEDADSVAEKQLENNLCLPNFDKTSIRMKQEEEIENLDEKKTIEELFPKLCTEEIHIKDEFEESNVETNNENSKFAAIAEATNKGLQENYYSEEATSSSSVSKSSLVEHIQITIDEKFYDYHREERLYECLACQCKFTTKGTLKRHMQIHTWEINHIRTHTNEKLYECPLCEYKCSQEAHLNQHIETHTHPSEKKSYTGERPYECPVCQHKFAVKASLKRHMRTHTWENPYECYFCEKTFIYKKSLIEHIRIHTGEKPYECHLCDYKCAQKSRLNGHIKTHIHPPSYGKPYTGEKPYECLVCQHKFAAKTSLTRHMQTHTSKNPFECSFCQKTFVYKIYLVEHLRIHTGEKPYECRLCEYKCARKTNLNQHIKTKHSS